MILKISLLVLFLFLGCSSEEKATKTEQGLVVDLQYPEAFMTLSHSGKKKFEEEILFYQFHFRGSSFHKTIDPIDRRDYSRYVFNDIPFDENLVIHVEALDKTKQRVCYGEQGVRYVSGSLVSITLPLICPNQTAVTVEMDSSEIDVAGLGSSDSELLLSEFPQRKSFPFIYSTLLLRSKKSSVPLLIQVNFEGYLDAEVQRSQQYWQDDVLERTTVGDVERWSKAPVTLEVKELKEDGKLGDAEIQKISNEKSGILLKNGLVFVFKTDVSFKEFPWTTRDIPSDMRVDHVKLQGRLKILSAPAHMEKSFYADSQNWTDITPQDPFPLLKIVSK